MTDSRSVSRPSSDGDDDGGSDGDGAHEGGQQLPSALTIRLYTSHFLSTWNSRLFEFGAVLFLASIFPHTLLPMSVYALARSAAAITLAQPVGACVDRGHRLKIVRASIVGQRLAVALSCAVFAALLQRRSASGAAGLAVASLETALLAGAVVLACVEKLCATVNLVAVERDWVVVITEGNAAARTDLNARMRRIDLLCKLLGPLAISTIAAAFSVPVAVWATFGMNLASIAVEYVFIAQVYHMVPRLSREHPREQRGEPELQEDGRLLISNEADEQAPGLVSSGPTARVAKTGEVLFSFLAAYFSHPAFLPSFSLALLYLTVLSFSGQMVTYLMSVGYSPLHVGLVRTASTIFELSATWIGPQVVKRIGVVRGGIWSLCWQMVWLAAGASWFLRGGLGSPDDAGSKNMTAATGLVVGVALSRVGLWGFDLCAQNIVQDEVEADHRGTFSALESSFQNLFELLSYAITVIFSRPDQFRFPVLVSIVAVYVSGGLYAVFVRKRRGHLFHAPRSACVCSDKPSPAR
ncbi:Ferroporti-1 [Lasiosphaeria miniovina]|uniref:Solute carrier family 40 member n=1 Tax=Lasiosphaeria miniovina TaxID=1954250 RepID=A0AA40AD54_9PEZI|nr:Ferroporti-1 [Lasiosphaeria miniovina]KAK0713701.1 Ferroporti-1 [Lasiosphaeria miniovina]